MRGRYTGSMKLARLFLASLTLTGSAFPQISAQQASLQVAFTFDDLPAHGPLPPGEYRPEPIRSIIKTLKTENMPPVYGFVNGFRTAQYPYQTKLLREWIASGNPLGNHTWSHPSLDKSTAKKYIHNIAENEPLLEKVDPAGDWHWFRFPYLEEGDTLAKRDAVRDYLLGHNYKIAEVNLDFGDYLWNDAYARCAAKKDDAAVASLHDSYLATADEYITYSRTLSQRLYGRDISVCAAAACGSVRCEDAAGVDRAVSQTGLRVCVAAAGGVRSGIQRRSEGGIPWGRVVDGAGGDYAQCHTPERDGA